MTRSPTATLMEADGHVTALVTACTDAGLEVQILEPSTRLKVFSPAGNAHLDETITLRPDADEELTWYWSWGSPIGPAYEVANTVLKLKRVVSATVM